MLKTLNKWLTKTLLPSPATAAAQDNGVKRSPKWPTVRKKFLKKVPACACGCTVDLEAHHVIPFHFCILLGRPDLELDERNLIVLCDCPQHQHHLLIGHLDDFKTSNPKVREDALQYSKSDHVLIKTSQAWLDEKQARPNDWANMTEQDKKDLRARMDAEMPLITE